MFSDHRAWRWGWRWRSRGRFRCEARSLVSTVVGASRLRSCVWWLCKNRRQTDLFSAASPSSDIFISLSLHLPHVAFFFPRLINIYWSNNTRVWTIRIIKVSRVTQVQYLPPFRRKVKSLHQLCARGKVWLSLRGRVRERYSFLML